MITWMDIILIRTNIMYREIDYITDKLVGYRGKSKAL